MEEVNDNGELCATIRPFTEIIGEWRDEITGLVSSEKSEPACTACGSKGNISRQVQRYEKALENQVQRVQQLQVMASALERGATRVLNKVEDQINRVNYRRDLAERAVLSDAWAKNCIISGNVLDAVSRDILDAAICTFFPELPGAQKDPVKKNQLEMLQRNLETDGRVHLKGLLDDVYYLSQAEAQNVEEPVLHWQRGQSHEEKAMRLRERVFKNFDSYKHEAASQHELIGVNRKLASDSKAKLDAKKALLDCLRGRERHAERRAASDGTSNRPLSRRTVLGKRSRSLSINNPSDLPSITWNAMPNTEKISRLEKEAILLEDTINTANDKISKGRNEVSRLEPVVSILRRGTVILRDEEMVIDLIGLEDPRHRYTSQSHISKSYAEDIRRSLGHIDRLPALNLVDILFGDTDSLMERLDSLLPSH